MMTRTDGRYCRVPQNAGTSVCRRLCVAAILVAVVWAAVPVNAEPTFEDQLNEINEAARDARDSGKLETV